MQRKSKFLILLLIILLPFSVLAEGEISEQPNGVTMENDPNMVQNGEMTQEEKLEEIVSTEPATNEVEEPVTDTETTETEDIEETTTLVAEENTNEEITLVESTSDSENEVPEEVDSPQNAVQWTFVIVSLSLIIIIFGFIVFMFFKLFSAYSSVFEKLDDSTESVITID